MPPKKKGTQKPAVWRLSHQKLPLSRSSAGPARVIWATPQQVRRAKQHLLHQYWSPPPGEFLYAPLQQGSGEWVALGSLSRRVLRVDKNSRRCSFRLRFVLCLSLSIPSHLHLSALHPVLSFPFLSLFHRSSSPSCRSQHRPSLCLRCVCVCLYHPLTAAG